MTELKQRVKFGLDDGRILMLAAQVIVGFTFRSVFEPGFEKMPESSQYLRVLALALMLVAVVLLLTPPAYHQLVADGNDTLDVQRVLNWTLGLALLPFAIALGIDFFTSVERITSRGVALTFGVAATVLALLMWYGWEAVQRPKRRQRHEERRAMSEGEQGAQQQSGQQQDGGGGTETKDKVDHVLTEARMALPGAQALLGFQFATILTEAFERLPRSLKYVHVASMTMIAISIILLIAPAAYHRLFEQGEATEHFHRVASRLIVLSMVTLALGIVGDFYLVVRKVTESYPLALTAAGLLLLLCYALWFGFTAIQRARRGSPA